MLHCHLTVAFRALDRKWGEPVDLDTTDESIPCTPALVERPTTTFSSEEYLNTVRRRRPKPYSREERQVRKSKLKDSFSNISVSRYPSSDLGGSVSSLESRALEEVQNPRATSEQSSRQDNGDDLIEEMRLLVESLKKPLKEHFETDSAAKLALERRKIELKNIFRQLQDTAVSYVERKFSYT